MQTKPERETLEEGLVTDLFTGVFDPSKLATLDSILEKTSCPKDYDILSIDIDSFDLEVWQAHTEYRPKIVVIEINSSIFPGILQWHGGHCQGNSFSSTLSVAKAKGYTLAFHTGNMIFVRNDLANLIGLLEVDVNFPERLFDPRSLPMPDIVPRQGHLMGRLAGWFLVKTRHALQR